MNIHHMECKTSDIKQIVIRTMYSLLVAQHAKLSSVSKSITQNPKV